MAGGSDGTDAGLHRRSLAGVASRRGFLAGGALLLAAVGCSDGGPSGGGTPAPPRPTGRATLRPATPIPGVGDGVFSLGVASGDPLPDGVILWTRLVAPPSGGTPLPSGDIPVDWQVATDEKFADVVAAGTQAATPGLAHSVHVDVRGLQPGRAYFYRFRAGTVLSPVGRTRTAPAASAAVSSLSFALASCQDFQNGYWPAYNAIATDNLDLVVHVGDYIYEYDPNSRFPDRRHTAPATPGLNQLRTLDDYRNRYTQYKSDPALQAAHTAAPWVVVWDDHETENGYAGLTDESGDTGDKHQDPAAFARQRAAAYQAYYEHMPIRVGYVPDSPDLRIYRRFTFGDLLTLNMMDTRQYRTPQPGRVSQDIGDASLGENNTAGTMSGAEQEAWLIDGLRASSTRWNVIAQQTMMAQLHARIAPGLGDVLTNLDQNDGYVPYRTRLLSAVRDSRARNPVVLSGDIHSAWVNDLRVDFNRPETPVIGTEFVCTSVSSGFLMVSDDLVRMNNRLLNPHVRYFRGDRRGYTRVRVTPGEWRAEMRVAETIERRDAPVTTDATWVVEDSRPGAQLA
ncbi:alkaline phosphatase D family protein [Protofrankia coriariae]|uniref:Alkaline phosphatase n=1 Tax=Protofrankia coriariae TaxID=1562887 RepID=A0ABR5F8I4_9ACTN|nr:alkaline phosphatase D family protein [Protofrankia coriariae]KLL13037.1 alkaline phosphatase [Protofrankia coriariae]